jgi:hypothetical protein
MTTAPPITWTRVFTLSAVWLLVLAFANRALRWFDFHVVEIDRPPWWPVGVFESVSLDGSRIAMACVCIAAGWFAWRWLESGGFRMVEVALACIVLTICSNLIQGWQGAFVTPIAGGEGESAIQYYHDAANVTDASDFLAQYKSLQANLHDHARTHPPGAVLTIHWLNRLTGSPAAISVIIMSATIAMLGALSAGSLSGFGLLLLLLTPAMQIYSCASVDALIAPMIFGAVILSIHRSPLVAMGGSAALLLAASSLTFAALFALPVMVAFEWLRSRRVTRSIASILIVATTWAVISVVTGFNYWQSFRIAASIENPAGFLLFADPASYFVTRAECILEIALFLSPILCLLLMRGLFPPTAEADRSVAISGLAIAVLVAMFATGAFHTGETARACLFIYPFLIPAIVAGLDGTDARQRRIIAMSVFGQSVLMQLAGSYFW